MVNILLPNIYELIVIVTAVVMLWISYRRGGYQKRQRFVWILVMIPVFYFSINMVTEVVTADESQYEVCISDIRHLKNYGSAVKVLYEYKLTQLTIGTVFFFFPNALREHLGANKIWMIYKCLHWLLMYIFSLGTVAIWRKFILISDRDRRKRLAENAVLMVLVGLPLSCLLMKVTNYDATSTYPAIVGFSLILAAFNRHDLKMGFLGTVVTALGVLDKWTALPYWIISVILFAIIASIDKQTWTGKIKSICLSSVIAYAAAILVSIMYFIYEYFLQRGFCKKIDVGIIVFSFVHALKGIATGDLSVNSSNADIIYIPVLLFIIITATIIVLMIYKGLKKVQRNMADVLLKIDGVFLSVGIIGGIIGAYFIPLRIAPFLQIASDEYISTDSFDGWTYHFGMKSAIGHFIAKVCYEWATIVVNYPSVVVIFLLLIAVLIITHRNEESLLICSLGLSAAIALLFFYAIAGLPSDARYYSWPMFIIVLAAIYLAYIQDFRMKKYQKSALAICYGVYILEMCLFIPNVKSFSPLWLWHGKEHNNTVRQGKWYAGEIMFWGENLAIAGNIIQQYTGKEKCDDVIIYDGYGSGVWPGNPGYVVDRLWVRKEQTELRFDKNAYYVINKFSIFRNKTPAFIYEVEPIARISYKGETGAWIYRGDQLKDYADELLIK